MKHVSTGQLHVSIHIEERKGQGQGQVVVHDMPKLEGGVAGPAEAAGVRVGDTILSVGGTILSVAGKRDIYDVAAIFRAAGGVITVRVLRGR